MKTPEQRKRMFLIGWAIAAPLILLAAWTIDHMPSPAVTQSATPSSEQNFTKPDRTSKENLQVVDNSQEPTNSEPAPTVVQQPKKQISTPQATNPQPVENSNPTPVWEGQPSPAPAGCAEIKAYIDEWGGLIEGKGMQPSENAAAERYYWAKERYAKDCQ